MAEAQTLRLALAMRGGVSLSVWIGGAVQEVDRLRRDLSAEPGATDDAEDERSLVGRLAERLGYQRVEVDVVSGASAGGLNAVLLGAAMVADEPLSGLRRTWLETADLQDLLRKAGRTKALSVLDGDRFRSRLRKALDAYLAGREDEPSIERLEVLLSVTSIVPATTQALTDPNAPVTDQRIDGLIRLRHRPGYSDFTGDGDALDELTLAARSTASFPGAFQPEAIAARADGTTPLETKLEVRPRWPEPLFLYDGGVVDNMPVGKAVAAIGAAAADGPTERVLLYLHPSPGTESADAKAKTRTAREEMTRKGARPLDVGKSALKSFRTKSLADDLHSLESHNARIAASLSDRQRLLRAYIHCAELPADPPDAVDLDAERLVDLLVAPWDHVAEGPSPRRVAPVIDGELASTGGTLITSLRDLLSTWHPRAGLPTLSARSPRPWSAPIRTASLLIEWARDIERRADEDTAAAVGLLKQDLYRTRGRLLEDAVEVNHGLLDAVEASGWQTPEELASIVENTRSNQLDSATVRGSTRWSEVADVWNHLEEVGWLLHVGDQTSPSPGALSEQLRALLPVGISPFGVGQALDGIDVALLPLHRSAPTGSLDRVRYVTLAGTADTPLAHGYDWGRSRPPDATALTSLSYVQRALADPPPGFAAALEQSWNAATGTAAGGAAASPSRPPIRHPALIDPTTKLAGNQLSNFAAFLERSWRANDWMWGQIDASTTLIRLLLDGPRRSSISAKDVEELVCRPFARDPDAERDWRDELDEKARRVWQDVGADVTAELTGGVEESEIPPSSPGGSLHKTASVLLWRRHLEIIGTELARRSDENPTGTAPSTLDATMSTWDGGQRRVLDRWGERRYTALGMRASFVAWRVLFARAGSWLGLFRWSLAPILAPIVWFVLARHLTIVAIEVFLLGVVTPRLDGDGWRGPAAVAVIAAVVGVGGMWLTHLPGRGATSDRRTKITRYLDRWVALTALLVTANVAMVTWLSWPEQLLPDPSAPDRGIWPYVVPAIAVVASTLIIWYWAELHWALAMSVVNAGIACGFVKLAAMSVENDVVQVVASIWWLLPALALVTTVVGFNIDVGRYAPRPDGPTSADPVPG